MLIVFSLNSQDKIPIFIESQEKIFHKISNELKKNLPRKIEILAIDILFLNGDKNSNDKIRKNYYIILETQQFVNQYSLEFLNKIKLKDLSDDLTRIQNYNDLELAALAKLLNKDAVLITSVTTLENQKKKIWDDETKKTKEKGVGIIQGIILNTESSEVLYRFFYYFLID